MTSRSTTKLEALWDGHSQEWRDPAQIVSQWREADKTDPHLLQYKVRGAWWDVLEKSGVTLLLTREYEHLLIAVSAAGGRARVSFQPLPHPSGLAVDRERNLVYVASTRNPNQVYELTPATGLQDRLDFRQQSVSENPLVARRSWFLPGCLYIHDLALIGGNLHANAVGHNAIIRLRADAHFERVWWPRCIEKNGKPIFGRNHLQLNSIAAANTLSNSFFSASCDEIGARRPGHRNFVVDGRGVIFSGKTREPIVRGLTRPHSARLRGKEIWVNNSGYGELGVAMKGKFVPVARLPGWTRGLCLCGSVAFVGTSRVIPRFRNYAPGLDVDASECAVHAVDTLTGQSLGSMIWPAGNQIFAIDWISATKSLGFPFLVGARRRSQKLKSLFYAFQLTKNQ